MTMRWMVVLAMVFGGSAIAQQPTGVPSAPPPPQQEGPVNTTAVYPPHDLEEAHGPTSQIWAVGEYLLGHISGADLPGLLTSSPLGTPQAQAGLLGAPDTQVLFGGMVNTDVRSGFRVGAGYRFACEPCLGIEAGYWYLPQQNVSFATTTATNPIITRPFIDANTSQPQAIIISFPGVATGSASVQFGSSDFNAGNINLSETFCDEGWLRMEALVGYRFYTYNENLQISQSISPLNPVFAPGTQIDSIDDFRTKNEFHGCDVGVRTTLRYRQFNLDLLGKVAFGNLRREVQIQGVQVTTVPGTPTVTLPGGAFALSSNSGTFVDNTGSVLPELGANLGWQISSYLKFRVGYSVLLPGSVARPYNQIDFRINQNLFPPPLVPVAGPLRPRFNLAGEDISVRNVSFGFEFTY